MKRFLYIFTLVALFNSCITPEDVDLDQRRLLLVVNGYITTEQKAHRFEFLRTAKYGRVADGSQAPETRAFVAIKDNEGVMTVLSEIGNGVYETPENFAAEVGKSYTLVLESRFGGSFISYPQMVTPAPEIKDLIVQFREKPSPNPILSESGFDVIVNFDDPSSQENYYLWRLGGIYQIATRPDLYAEPGPDRTPGVPTPKDCCATCYVTERSPQFFISSDNFYDGRNHNQLVTFLPDNGRRLNIRYYLEIEQMAIPQEAFQHYALVNNQLSISGSIFDPPPATIRGNMINLENPEEEVIGYFGAYDIKKTSKFLDLSLLEIRQREIILNDDCRVLANSETDRPPFWDN